MLIYRRKLTLYHTKLKKYTINLFLHERSFQRLLPILGCHRISFQAPDQQLSARKFVALFHNANVLVKALIMIFTQISTVLWKLVQMWPQKVQFDSELADSIRKLLNFLLVFHTLVVSQEVWNYWLQWLLRGQFSFAKCFIKHWVLLEFFFWRPSNIPALSFSMLIHRNF